MSYLIFNGRIASSLLASLLAMTRPFFKRWDRWELAEPPTLTYPHFTRQSMSLRVRTQKFGHNVRMTGSKFTKFVYDLHSLTVL